MFRNKDSGTRVIKAISMHDFRNQELISEGSFGQVYRADWLPSKEHPKNVGKGRKADKMKKNEKIKVEKENIEEPQGIDERDKLEVIEEKPELELKQEKPESEVKQERPELDRKEERPELDAREVKPELEGKEERPELEGKEGKEGEEKQKEGKVQEALKTPEKGDTSGQSSSVDVVIKVLKNVSVRQVLAERDRLAVPNHENIVKLLGAVYLWKGASIAPWLVLENLPLGNLRKYIVSQRNTGGISANGMMKIAWGIARGMEYLHSNGIIHGDLATRNCILGHKWTVKIGDLGYYDEKNARYYHNYKQSEVIAPLRWMSPENLPYKVNRLGYMIQCKPRHSYAGDVWSYGIVLYELWSRAKDPFHKLSDNYDVCDALLQGVTPTEFQKIKVRRHIWNLMHHCWEFQPSSRPKAADVVDHFEVNEGHVWLMANDYISI